MLFSSKYLFEETRCTLLCAIFMVPPFGYEGTVLPHRVAKSVRILILYTQVHLCKSPFLAAKKDLHIDEVVTHP